MPSDLDALRQRQQRRKEVPRGLWQEDAVLDIDTLLASLDVQQQDTEAQLSLAMAMHHAASGQLVPPKNAPSFVHQVADLRAERDVLQQRLDAVTALPGQWLSAPAVTHSGPLFEAGYSGGVKDCAASLAAVLTGASK